MLERPRLICKPSQTATPFLLTQNQRVRLRADLPPWMQAHFRAAPVLCEALWLQSPLSVVLDVDTPDPSSVLGLCAAFGFVDPRPHYEVEGLGPDQNGVWIRSGPFIICKPWSRPCEGADEPPVPRGMCGDRTLVLC